MYTWRDRVALLRIPGSPVASNSYPRIGRLARIYSSNAADFGNTNLYSAAKLSVSVQHACVCCVRKLLFLVEWQLQCLAHTEYFMQKRAVPTRRPDSQSTAAVADTSSQQPAGLPAHDSPHADLFLVRSRALRHCALVHCMLCANRCL